MEEERQPVVTVSVLGSLSSRPFTDVTVTWYVLPGIMLDSKASNTLPSTVTIIGLPVEEREQMMIQLINKYHPFLKNLPVPFHCILHNQVLLHHEPLKSFGLAQSVGQTWNGAYEAKIKQVYRCIKYSININLNLILKHSNVHGIEACGKLQQHSYSDDLLPPSKGR